MIGTSFFLTIKGNNRFWAEIQVWLQSAITPALALNKRGNHQLLNQDPALNLIGEQGFEMGYS